MAKQLIVNHDASAHTDITNTMTCMHTQKTCNVQHRVNNN